jgi:hypothetical protein
MTKYTGKCGMTPAKKPVLHVYDADDSHVASISGENCISVLANAFNRYPTIVVNLGRGMYLGNLEHADDVLARHPDAMPLGIVEIPRDGKTARPEAAPRNIPVV